MWRHLYDLGVDLLTMVIVVRWAYLEWRWIDVRKHMCEPPKDPHELSKSIGESWRELGRYGRHQGR